MALFFVTVIFTGCSGSQQEQNNNTSKYYLQTVPEKIDKFGRVIIRDGKVDCDSLAIDNNVSSLRFFIRIDASYENPSNHVYGILGILECFEYKYPDLQIKSWSIEKTQRARDANHGIHGIWLDCAKKSR